MLTSSLQAFNLEQAEYLASVYVDDPDVVGVQIVPADGAWRLVVTRR